MIPQIAVDVAGELPQTRDLWIQAQEKSASGIKAYEAGKNNTALEDLGAARGATLAVLVRTSIIHKATNLEKSEKWTELNALIEDVMSWKPKAW